MHRYLQMALWAAGVILVINHVSVISNITGPGA